MDRWRFFVVKLVCMCAYIISSALGICGYFFGQIRIISAQKPSLGVLTICHPNSTKKKTRPSQVAKTNNPHDIQCSTLHPVTPINHHTKKNSPQPGSLVFPVPTAGAARGGGLKGLLANFSMP